MIRQAEKTAREATPEPLLAGYRLEGSPGRREGDSLLFAALAPDGGRVSVQVSPEPVANRRLRARFRRLARSRAEISYPALLGVREVGEENGRPFIVAERFPARSLGDLLRNGPLAPATALSLLRPVADGLDAAHAAGLVHRTLSAESVLLDGDAPKLDLFGVFTVVESPEAARGDELVPASNVYSLTALLFHALTGRQPSASPSELNGELPAALRGVIARGMASDPAERPETAGALIARAATLLRTADAGGARLAPFTPRPASAGPAKPANGSTPPPPATERRPPLKTRVAPLWPPLVVALVAAAFGALLGMPGGESTYPPLAARSSEELAVQRLDEVRHRLRDELALAATPSEQADVAERLAMAYGRAGDALRSPEAVAAAQRASAAYAALGQAARDAKQHDYDTARADVAVAESQLGTRLSGERGGNAAGSK